MAEAVLSNCWALTEISDSDVQMKHLVIRRKLHKDLMVFLMAQFYFWELLLKLLVTRWGLHHVCKCTE